MSTLPKFISELQKEREQTNSCGHPRGVDGRFLLHFRLDSDEAIQSLGKTDDDLTAAEWFLRKDGVSEAATFSWNGIAVNLGRPRFPGEAELPLIIRLFIGVQPGSNAIGSFFEAIEFDEAKIRSTIEGEREVR